MLKEELLKAKFKPFGRTVESGLDCYGYCILRAKCSGLILNDIVFDWNEKTTENINSFIEQMNIEEINQPEKDCIIQCDYNNELHVAYYEGNGIVSHQTYEGVKQTPVLLLHNVKYFRIKK